MATPKMLVKTIQVQGQPGGESVIRVNTFNPDGTPLDVSSGFTLLSANAQPAQDANPNNPYSTDISGAMTTAFDATGFNITANWGLINAEPATLHSNVLLYISNDAGSTQNVAAVLAMGLNLIPGTTF